MRTRKKAKLNSSTNTKIHNTNELASYKHKQHKKTIKTPTKNPKINPTKNPKINSSRQNQLVELTNFKFSDKQALLELTSKSNIMNFIGLGKTWSADDVDKYINYTLQDAKIPIHKRQWFSYAIRYNQKLAGVVEFKTMTISKYIPLNIRIKYKNDVVMTIYINDTYQGKGIAKKTVELLKAKIQKYKPHATNLVAMVKVHNLVMHAIMPKLGFTKLDNVNIIRKDGIISNTVIYKTLIYKDT